MPYRNCLTRDADVWHDDQREQRIADKAYDDACDERDKRTREKRPNSSGSTRPSASTQGLRPSSRSSQGAAGGRKVDVCLTCHAKVTWKEEGRTWVPYDYASDVKHRCK